MDLRGEKIEKDKKGKEEVYKRLNEIITKQVGEHRSDDNRETIIT